MRDVLLLGLLPLMLFAMAKRPFIAVGMWVWTALFFPNGWVYGAASSLRYNLLFAGVAIIGYIAMKKKPRVHFGVLGALVMLFFFWATISTVFTEGDPARAWVFWERFFKIVLLFVFVVLVCEKKLHLDFLLWAVVLSVGFYGNLEALKFIASGGGHKIEGIYGHVLADRNELSIAFVMTLPICYYLVSEYGSRSWVVRYGLIATMSLLVFGVIGTQSRGGFIAMLALGSYLFIKSERKLMMGLLIVGLTVAAVHLASSEFVARINTIESADEDASFMGRVVAWKLSFILAAQHPFFGGGFKALETYSVWSSLCQQFFSYSWFYTGEALPNPSIPRAAHSVYFQVLGDHGFIGLGIYVSILAASFIKAGNIAKAAARHPQLAWLRNLASMTQLSIFAFCLGGLSLSFAYFDLIFALFATVIVLEYRVLPAALALSRSVANIEAKPANKPGLYNAA